MPGPIPPITTAEFFQYFQRCIPPTGWSHRIAVANSGGPDSTALLFLLNALLQERAALKFPPEQYKPGSPRATPGVPKEVVSIHVNHSLQDAASIMESVAIQSAERLGIRHSTEKIPWGEPPYPTRKDVDEKVAREARYHRLFRATQEFRTNVIAFGHHADDQVETAIMRMSQGSSSRGLAAMRPVRRWGMGKREQGFFSFGAEGMRSWIVRPFLPVSKDRILATCEANKLDYVNDPTNFQPGLTFRNGVRNILSTKAQDSLVYLTSKGQAKIKIEPYIEQLRAMVPHVHPKEQLRDAVRLYGMRLEEVDARATNILLRARMPSPPSTLLLKSRELAEATDDDVRIGLIRRSLRFVSHGPWGSVWSEASGDRDTLRRIAEVLWPSKPRPPYSELPIDPKTGLPEDPRRTFSAGAGVVGYPVVIKLRDGSIRFRSPEKGEVEGWIFARTPPYSKARASTEAYAIADVTDELLAAHAAGENEYRTLYDHRFELVFDLARKLPHVIRDELERRHTRIVIHPDTRWVLPKVMLEDKGTKERCIGKYLWHLPGWKDTRRRPMKFQSWIDMRFVRSLEAV
ncbi:PP-loop family-domain-containing protein [Cubamyces lactineus]|nr:PP-loop family-domain-containing protein [Cubamyces lactineus]